MGPDNDSFHSAGMYLKCVIIGEGPFPSERIVNIGESTFLRVVGKHHLLDPASLKQTDSSSGKALLICNKIGMKEGKMLVEIPPLSEVLLMPLKFFWEEVRTCRFCHEEIEHDLCWCGDFIDDHDAWCGHSPVPMGCRCGFASEHDDLCDDFSDTPGRRLLL